ncbi:MAG: chemotaxis protein CheW [Gammaproteobacteria bacterium]|nr:chemotaxis protein CheW [Gammaproteobacteria bacterium]MDH5692974.1 chemotaxis protein CheW [Gammaproteobacteria bacterium]
MNELNHEQINQRTDGPVGDELQYLTFILQEEEYGVEIIKVQEIKGWSKVTPIPSSPPYVKGIINLRGQIVPIIDLRERFGMEYRAYDATTVVVVLHVRHGEREQITGFVVDAVSDVYNISKDAVKAVPDMGSGVQTEFVQGVATVDDRMVIILDMNKLFAAKDIELISNLGGTQEDAA